MLPGLPPRDKSFKGWLFPLVLPLAAFVVIGSLAMSAACLFGDSAITINGTRYTGFSAVLRILLTAPLLFLAFLLFITTICWLDSRMTRRPKWRVKTRIHHIAVALYSLPFLAVIAFSLFFMWAGNIEMIITGIALLPAVLYFLGLRWCRYVVGVIAALGLLTCSLRALPALTTDQGRYFWLIWSPIWLVFAFSTVTLFIPVARAPDDAA